MFEPITFPPDIAAEFRRNQTRLVYVADEFPGYPCRECPRDAEVGDQGAELPVTILRFMGNETTNSVDVQNATRGCWAARYIR